MMRSIFYFTGGILVLLLLVLFGISSCTGDVEWAKTCENGGIYKTHKYDIDGFDSEDRLIEVCRNCGLRKKFCEGLYVDQHYGAIELYCNPKTGNFDTYVLEYIEDGGRFYRRVYEKDLKTEKK